MAQAAAQTADTRTLVQPANSMLPNDNTQSSPLHQHKLLGAISGIAQVEKPVVLAPELLRRYPENNHKDFKLPTDVVYFCQPEGCITYAGKKQNPTFRDTSSFVFTLTDKDSGKIRYGVCVNFYRTFEMRSRPSSHSKTKSDPVWAALTGQWSENITDNVMKEIREIETWILRLLSAPVPVPGKTRVELYLLPQPKSSCTPMPIDSMVSQIQYWYLQLALPDHTRFSLIDLPLHLPLELLGVETVVRVLTCVMLEYKVVLQSRDYAAVSMCVLALVALLYPLEYMFPVIPLLPAYMNASEQLLLAPTPYIIGVPASFFIHKNLRQLPNDVILVDLDSNRLIVPETQVGQNQFGFAGGGGGGGEEQIPDLPEPELTQLMNSLRQALNMSHNIGTTPNTPAAHATIAPKASFGEIIHPDQMDEQLQVGSLRDSCDTGDPLQGCDIDAVDVAARVALVRFFNAPNVLGDFSEHCRTLRLYPRPVVALQQDSFLRSRPIKSDFITRLSRTQAVEYFAECSLCPKNEAYLRVQTGMTDPEIIGDKPKWYAEQLQLVEFGVCPEESTLPLAWDMLTKAHANRLSSYVSTDESGGSGDENNESNGNCPTSAHEQKVQLQKSSPRHSSTSGKSPMKGKGRGMTLDQCRKISSGSASSASINDLVFEPPPPITDFSAEPVADHVQPIGSVNDVYKEPLSLECPDDDDDSTKSVNGSSVSSGRSSPSSFDTNVLDSEADFARMAENLALKTGEENVQTDQDVGEVDARHSDSNEMTSSETPTLKKEFSAIKSNRGDLMSNLGKQLNGYAGKTEKLMNKVIMGTHTGKEHDATSTSGASSTTQASNVTQHSSPAAFPLNRGIVKSVAQQAKAAANTIAHHGQNHPQPTSAGGANIPTQMHSQHPILAHEGGTTRSLIGVGGTPALNTTTKGVDKGLSYAQQRQKYAINQQKAQRDRMVLNAEKAAQLSRNQAALKEICDSVLNGQGVGLLSIPKLKRLCEDESMRQVVATRLNLNLRHKHNSEDEELDDVHLSRAQYKGYLRVLSACLSGIEAQYLAPGATGLASTLQILEIAHTHYWAQAAKEQHSGGSLTPTGKEWMGLTSPLDHRKSPHSHQSSREPSPNNMGSSASVCASPRVLARCQKDAVHDPILQRQGSLDNMTAPKSNTDKTQKKPVRPPPPRQESIKENSKLGLNLQADVCKSSSQYSQLSDASTSTLVAGHVTSDSGVSGIGSASPPQVLTPSHENNSADSSISESHHKQKVEHKEAVIKTYLYQDLFPKSGAPQGSVWSRPRFWEDVFYDAVAHEREVVGMDQQPHEMMQRYSQLSEGERKRLELTEDRLLATLMHNLAAFMVMCGGCPSKAVQQKIRRLLGKSHVGLVHSQHINRLLDNINEMRGNDIPLKPRGSQLMHKFVFTVHAGSDSGGHLAFMEICDDAIVVRGVSGAVMERWWYEKLVNMTYSPKTRVLCLWRRCDEQVLLHRFYTRKCRDVYACVKRAMERAAERGRLAVPGRELGGEFPVVDVDAGVGGLLQVRIDGIQMVFAESKRFIELSNIKKCNSQGGNVFVLEEYDRSQMKMVQRKYASQMADQICYAVLCVFSYVAAHQNRAAAAVAHPLGQKSTNVSTVSTSLDIDNKNDSVNVSG